MEVGEDPLEELKGDVEEGNHFGDNSDTGV